MQTSASGLLEQLNNIPKHKPVTLEWLDASTTKKARVNKFPLPNYYVETRRSTTGAFLCLQKSYARKIWHAVIQTDIVDDADAEIKSIPLCLIHKVSNGGEIKFGEQIEKRIIRLRDGATKFIETYAKPIFLHDGAVKYVD